jgi:hypothetical protein
MNDTNSKLDALEDELKLFSKQADAYVPMKRTRTLKFPARMPAPAPKIEIVDDDTDPLAPIVRMIRDGKYEFIPWKDCVEGDRVLCDKYDQLVRASEGFCKKVPKSDQKYYTNPPDALFLRTLPRACRVCLYYQHLDKKREIRLSRRLARWLRLRLHLKKSPSKAS